MSCHKRRPKCRHICVGGIERGSAQFDLSREFRKGGAPYFRRRFEVNWLRIGSAPREGRVNQNPSENPSEAGESQRHQADHLQVDPGLTGSAKALIVFAQSAVVRESREGALHDLSAGNHVKAWGGKVLDPVDLLRWDILGDPIVFVCVNPFDRLHSPACGMLDPVSALTPPVVAHV